MGDIGRPERRLDGLPDHVPAHTPTKRPDHRPEPARTPQPATPDAR